MSSAAASSPLLPAVPVLVAGSREAVLLGADGELVTLSLAAAAHRVRVQPPIVCHARALARRLGCGPFAAFDLLELFAFVRPACFCLPTTPGLARALGLPVPPGLADEPLTLLRAAERLLRGLAGSVQREQERSDPGAIAWVMGQAGWPWAPVVLRVLGQPAGPGPDRLRSALMVWRRLPEWSVEAPEPPPGNVPVDPAEARARLAQLLKPRRPEGGSGDGSGGNGSEAGSGAGAGAGAGPGAEEAEVRRRDFIAEPRPQQADYASAVSFAFTPRAEQGAPNLVLAEAGTGVGKTLGYLAPATVWAEKNQGSVWISTYTRNLQHQIDSELERLFPDPAVKAGKVVIRKGRENYLCLLNFEEATRQLSLLPQAAAGLGLMARWTAATRDGDLGGADLPGWLIDLLGPENTVGLADRRGECIYSACDHYHRCFVERSVRRARRAEVVIANHALVMALAARGGDEVYAPTRYIFDEGHHVFDAADNAFSLHLTGREGQELRRWLVGADGSGRSRARGLARRLDDLIAGDDRATALVEHVMHAARALPDEGWAARLTGHPAQGEPIGAAEQFLALIRRQVLARARGAGGPFSLETEPAPPVEGLIDAAVGLERALVKLLEPLSALIAHLTAKLDDEAEELESEQRRRIDALARGLQRRAFDVVSGWRAMMDAIIGGTAPREFVDWFGVERSGGQERDVGYYRHHLDPGRAFAAVVASTAHGLAITSATLTDGSGNPERDWAAAEARTGAVHLPRKAMRAQVPSPFDYGARTRVLVVEDVSRDDAAPVATAFRELFLAAGGGGLGLFTAIGRLRAVQRLIAGPLEAAGLRLLAQHVDGLDVGTLIDIFRAEEESCLLGTDAVRDGIDVPGRSLRLIVFDRVPWPRPTILHRARRAAFGGREFDDIIVRLRLRQAFGRLIRRADDQGVFVLLDPSIPHRLLTAFPAATTPRRVGLAEAIRETRAFLAAVPPIPAYLTGSEEEAVPRSPM